MDVTLDFVLDRPDGDPEHTLTTAEDIDYVLETMPPLVERLRQMSPLYAKFVKSAKGGS